MPRQRKDGTLIHDRGGKRPGSGRLQTRFHLPTEYGHLVRNLTLSGVGKTGYFPASPDELVRFLIDQAVEQAKKNGTYSEHMNG